MDLRNHQKDSENPKETEWSWGLCVINNNTEQQKKTVEEMGGSPGEKLSS